MRNNENYKEPWIDHTSIDPLIQKEAMEEEKTASILTLLEATKELADLYECSYGRDDEHCHNEAWGVDHLTSCPKLVAEKAIERVRQWL